MGRKLQLGHINGTFGFKGWVKVFSDTNPRENIFSYKSWCLGQAPVQTPNGQARNGGKLSAGQNSSDGDLEITITGEWKTYRIVQGRRQGKNIVVKLDGIDDMESAQSLIGRIVAIERDQLPKLPANEFYWSDLLGFKVVDLKGTEFGSLDRMFETGANDVMVVISSTGEEILIPWIRESVIQEINSELREIVADWDPDF